MVTAIVLVSSPTISVMMGVRGPSSATFQTTSPGKDLDVKSNERRQRVRARLNLNIGTS